MKEDKPLVMRVAHVDGSTRDMRLYTDNRRKFYAYYWDADGVRTVKRVPKEVKDPVAACAWLREWYGGMLGSGSVDFTPTTIITLTTMSEWYAAHLDTKEEGTGRRHTSFFRMHVAPHDIAMLRVDTLKVSECVAYGEWLAARRTPDKPDGHAPNTLRNIVQSLREMYDAAQAHDMVPAANANPFRHKYMRKALPVAEKVAGNINVSTLQHPDVMRVLEASPPITAHEAMAHTAYVIGITTGLRRAEINGLAWRHLDNACVKVERQRCVKRVKGLSVAGFKPPKRRSFRTVPQHAILQEHLAAWRQRWETIVGRPPLPDDPVLTNARCEWMNEEPSRTFARDLAMWGCATTSPGIHPQTAEPISLPITFHSLRHTFITLLREADVDSVYIKALAGHKASDVTDAHYTAKSLPKLRQCIDKLSFEREYVIVTEEPHEEDHRHRLLPEPRRLLGSGKQ